jgi:hypothetical protein
VRGEGVDVKAVMVCWSYIGECRTVDVKSVTVCWS